MVTNFRLVGESCQLINPTELTGCIAVLVDQGPRCPDKGGIMGCPPTSILKAPWGMNRITNSRVKKRGILGVYF